MHNLIINRLGPLDHVEISCQDFMVFTGAQASGKSTLAKAVFFFRTIKEDIFSLIVKKSVNFTGSNNSDKLHKTMESELREKFLRVFGSSWGMDNDMYISYYYNPFTFIKLSLKAETKYKTPNYLWVEYSDNIKAFLLQSNNALAKYSSTMPDEEKIFVKEELSKLFSDEYETVFIPAGRSLITLLATQLNYIYSTMEDAQKRAIDYCTRNYLERILKIRPEFEYGLLGLSNDNPMKTSRQRDSLECANRLISKILKGSYRYNNGDERLEISSNHYVKINFTSSGQQEVVWILNLLYYYLLHNQKTNFIIEEPESHLFPDAQKYISELIALVHNEGHSIFMTTHSPYVLGSINNLLYAGLFKKADFNTISKIVNSKYWIKQSDFNSWFVKNGTIVNAIDSEVHLVDNELIDDISRVINDEYDKLFELKISNERAGE